MKDLCTVLIFLISFFVSANAQKIISGAERMQNYLPLLKNKNVAVFANQTSLVGQTHLVDTLLKRGVKIITVFAPEHGFRGNADAGEHVGSYIDSATNVEVVSMYGKKNKPSAEDIQNVDVLIFDIQDVGVRFYTFISSLQYFMETAIENNKILIILDRPNPNGFYVDGPVLEKKYKSFVGMQPVPIVYGMTIGEYAKMLLGEKWLDLTPGNTQQTINKFKLIIIPCKNYTHETKFVLPVKPSPNLPEIQSIYLYPSTCFFEGTVLSEGRGTEKPFQIFGHPSYADTLFKFKPAATEGAKNPKLKDQICYGWNLSGTPQQVLHKVDNKIQLKWLINAYKLFQDKSHFFISDASFNRLAGNGFLIQQIKDGIYEQKIRKSWQPALDNFKKIRKKYLLYKDFKK